MGKLAYEWCGLAHIPALVEQLLREEAAGLPVGDRKGSNAASAQASDRQTTHSLWMLSRKFIRLLLTTKVHPEQRHKAHTGCQHGLNARCPWLPLLPGRAECLVCIAHGTGCGYTVWTNLTRE